MKIIPPNGCMFCELEKCQHGSRLDGLHPRGVWSWVEPSDKLRKQRMLRNRMIRKGFTMNETMDDVAGYWIGKWVTYHGVTRKAKLGNGQKFKVIDVLDGTAVAIDTGIEGHEWVGVSSVKITSAPEDVVTVKASANVADFLDPHRSTIDAIDSEIKRLEDRVKELRAARQVISGLQ